MHTVFPQSPCSWLRHACMSADRCTSDANRHEREAMRSSAETRMAVSGPEAAKQRGTRLGLCTRYFPSRRAAGCGMLACRRTDARATPTDMSVKRCAATREREWLSAARKLRSSAGRKKQLPAPQAAVIRKAFCYYSESAVSSAFTMLFTAVRRALTEARMISTSTPAPQYSTPLFLLLTPT